MQIELINKSDLENIRHLQPKGWSDIIPEFEFYIEATYCHPLQVKVKNEVVGIGASIEFENTAWLAHIIVDINHRRQGIGQLIVKELLEYLKKRSVETCLLIATELGKPVYEKAGFKSVAEYVYLKNGYLATDIPISKKIRPFEEIYTDMVFKLDCEICGEDRSRILKDYLHNGYVFLDNNQVSGFYLADLREGLIVAKSKRAGEELLRLKFITHQKIVLPSDNVNGIRFLEKNGFTKTSDKGARMILGKNINWQAQGIFSRIGGNLG